MQRFAVAQLTRRPLSPHPPLQIPKTQSLDSDSEDDDNQLNEMSTMSDVYDVNMGERLFMVIWNEALWNAWCVRGE